MKIDENALAAFNQAYDAEGQHTSGVLAGLKAYESAKGSEQPTGLCSRHKPGDETPDCEICFPITHQPVEWPIDYDAIENFIKEEIKPIRPSSLRAIMHFIRICIPDDYAAPKRDSSQPDELRETVFAAFEMYEQAANAKSKEGIVSCLLNYLRSPKRESGWQPIETAPKWGDYWVGAIDGLGDERIALSSNWATPLEPTHWRSFSHPPLPKPPEDESRRGSDNG